MSPAARPALAPVPRRSRRPALRPTEFTLGLLAAATGLAAAISMADPADPLSAAVGRPLALAAVFLVVHMLFMARLPHADSILLPTVFVLMGLSVAFSRRLAPALDESQFRWLLLGATVIPAVAIGPAKLRWLRRYPYTFALAGVGLVGATLVAGRSLVEGGARLWLAVGPLQFQPSEVLKLVLVVFLAGYLTNRAELLSTAGDRWGPFRVPSIAFLAPLIIMLGAGLALVAVQRDLGAALILYLTGLGMVYIASGRAIYVVTGIAAFVAGAAWLNARVPLVAGRIAIWLDPWSQNNDYPGYQVVQALMAIGAGGVIGTGLGQGMPGAIPVVHSDFVYAAVAEELGIAGATGILALYAILFWRGWRTAMRAGTQFEGLLAAGLTLVLAVQTIVIVGGNLRLMPLTGITLPFLSHGGTSLLTSSVAIGLLMRISGRPVGVSD